MKSVSNIQKITKAMKMVAASKLGRAQTQMEVARPFVASIQEVMLPVLTPGEEDAAPESAGAAPRRRRCCATPRW